MTENEFKILIQKQLEKHGFEKYPVKMTNAFRTLGSIRSRNGIIKKFSFSRHLVKAKKGVAENTILHEIAHAIDIVNRGMSDHGPDWKAICRRIGADPTAKASDVYDDSMYQYQIICQSCGKIVGRRHTVTQRTRNNISRAYCRICGPGSKLTIEPAHNVEPIENVSCTFKASELAKVMGICPKKARRNLRAANVDHLKIGKSWVFAVEHENLIKEIIGK